MEIEMTYVFRQGDLPKLDLQVDCGNGFQSMENQMGIIHRTIRARQTATSEASPSLNTMLFT